MKKPVNRNRALQFEVQNRDPTTKEIIAEQQKEIARLQKSNAKAIVKYESEIAKLRAQLAEEKKNKIKLVIGKNDANL